ncbi:AGE family epimerase/isomerase [Pedobacter cryoconitis]|uniref:N-acylglucosamine 2-epimerase n=1 Tax=Pedobacter cryoconitis TaxID=188932 RepID=A0A7X0MH74_9SPHI|nr:AGE family epimerase/isomerase [Pedobacter cryoconitis]MBB6498844.1 N-acylglucosamine 2-epimerase [Pedobacter cryoconitis]
MEFREYEVLYRDNLLNDVVPFWLNKSEDKDFGGYFTCLDRNGEVYDTDKFIWLQCRQVWTFSMLYNEVEKKQEWLDFALQGAAFLDKHGRDEHGDWYFSLNQQGAPLIQPYNIFSDCFATMAYGQLFKATGNPAHAKIAKETFFNILQRRENPKGKYAKAYPETRPLQSFAIPMILTNLVLEIEHVLDAFVVNQCIKEGVDTVINKFYRAEFGMILENINIDGTFSDSFEGRLVNPGHGLESMWFLMDIGLRNDDKELIRKATDISLALLEFGWDQQYGGIFYFLDIMGHPPQQLEWDQKLWWVHVEAIVCMLKGYLHTGDIRCWQWFEKLHTYCFDHFVDKECGEWYGYLSRQGEVLLTLKGGKWKGCFHVPRGLYQASETLKQIAEKRHLQHQN